ncbi:unnamed protein product [Prunus armeniaca]
MPFLAKDLDNVIAQLITPINMIGVGILSVPYALSSGGWLSLIPIFVIAAAAFYSGLLIQRCMDEDSTIRTYPDIGEHAFGKKGRIVSFNSFPNSRSTTTFYRLRDE